MVVSHYRLDTLKSQAKTLKKLLTSRNQPCTSMQALNFIAQAHGASSWNALFCAHQMALNNISPTIDCQFIDEMADTARLSVYQRLVDFFNSNEHLADVASPMLDHMRSQYLPCSSVFYQNRDYEFTNFQDLYGNITLLSDKRAKHSAVFQNEILPELIKHSGVALISRNEMEDVFLSKNTPPHNKIFLDLLQLNIFWSDDTPWDKLETFYAACFIEAARNHPDAARCGFYLNAFFDCLNAMPRQSIPITPNELCFSVSQLMELLNNPALPGKVLEKVCKSIDSFTNIGYVRDEILRQKLTEEALDRIIEPLLSTLNPITRMIGQRDNEIRLCNSQDCVNLNTLFSEKKVVYLLLHEPSSKLAHMVQQREVSAGIFALFDLHLQDAQMSKRHGHKVEKKWLYTTYNTTAIPKGFVAMLVLRRAVLKSINSTCLPGDGTDRIFGLNSIEYAEMRSQASHVITLEETKRVRSSYFFESSRDISAIAQQVRNEAQ